MTAGRVSQAAAPALLQGKQRPASAAPRVSATAPSEARGWVLKAFLPFLISINNKPPQRARRKREVCNWSYLAELSCCAGCWQSAARGGDAHAAYFQLPSGQSKDTGIFVSPGV